MKMDMQQKKLSKKNNEPPTHGIFHSGKGLLLDLRNFLLHLFWYSEFGALISRTKNQSLLCCILCSYCTTPKFKFKTHYT
jgi:hypothetical protein